MIKIIALLSFLLISENSDSKIYVKNYFKNGNLKEEGWMTNDLKNDYWFYYYENGNKKEEGHYKSNRKEKWWIYYDKNGEILHKCEYKNNQLNGFNIKYNDDSIVLIEKYVANKLIKKWTSKESFLKDNPNYM